jgi:hypothetical protein
LQTYKHDDVRLVFPHHIRLSSGIEHSNLQNYVCNVCVDNVTQNDAKEKSEAVIPAPP